MTSDSRSDEVRLSTRRAYSGRVIDLDVESVRLPTGVIASLEMVRHPGAAAILPVLSPRGAPDPEVLLVRQYRYAAESFLYEVPAGRLHHGERPIDCARRELLEETGCRADRLDPLLGFYTTPGFTDEYIHVFVATGLERGPPNHERDEVISDIEAVRLSQALTLIRDGRVVDAKTLVALLYLPALLPSL
jgi:ADP-ribose pyrophosphatase